MSNHVAAKFMGIAYAELSSKEFQSKIDSLIDTLRQHFPTHTVFTQNQILIQFGAAQSNTPPETGPNFELHMVDANGLYGVKISKGSISLSTSEYVSYEDMCEMMHVVSEKVRTVLELSHVKNLSLKNINLFKHSPTAEQDAFEDIKEGKYWGRQNFPTLDHDFDCSGASTRHEYVSKDRSTLITIVSGIVMGDQSQSYIPPNEWDIWTLRKSIPVKPGMHLLIDISAMGNSTPNEPINKNSLAPYKGWETLQSNYDRLRGMVNNVYSNIAKD